MSLKKKNKKKKNALCQIFCEKVERIWQSAFFHRKGEKNMFEGQRLHPANFRKYINEEPIILSKMIFSVPSLLQDDYGELNDCVITSIVTIIKYYIPELNINNIYNTVESIAKAHGYKGWFGTPLKMIRTILNKSLKQFNINYKAYSYYIKNLCFDYQDIKNSIDNNKPILLNLRDDGRGFYKNHTVLIIGYLYTEHYKLLIIRDNWYKGNSYLDYNKLKSICSIQILK